MLLDYDTKKPVENVTIITSVTPYPGVGDGFNRFSGVAPGCKWAAIKVFDRDGDASSSGMTEGLDEAPEHQRPEERQDHQHQRRLPASGLSRRECVDSGQSQHPRE